MYKIKDANCLKRYIAFVDIFIRCFVIDLWNLSHFHSNLLLYMDYNGNEDQKPMSDI